MYYNNFFKYKIQINTAPTRCTRRGRCGDMFSEADGHSPQCGVQPSRQLSRTAPPHCQDVLGNPEDGGGDRNETSDYGEPLKITKEEPVPTEILRKKVHQTSATFGFKKVVDSVIKPQQWGYADINPKKLDGIVFVEIYVYSQSKKEKPEHRYV